MNNIKLLQDNLSLIRKTANLTQVELAKKISVKRQTITAIERGKYPLQKMMAMALIGLFISMSVENKMIGVVMNVVFDTTNLEEVLLKIANEQPLKKE